MAFWSAVWRVIARNHFLWQEHSLHFFVNNDYDCPMLCLSDSLILIPSMQDIRPVSILHLCNSDCTFKSSVTAHVIERTSVNVSSLSFQHNYCNDLYFYNIYCM